MCADSSDLLQIADFFLLDNDAVLVQQAKCTPSQWLATCSSCKAPGRMVKVKRSQKTMHLLQNAGTQQKLHVMYMRNMYIDWDG